jgi:hypothetical protein
MALKTEKIMFDVKLYDYKQILLRNSFIRIIPKSLSNTSVLVNLNFKDNQAY